MTEDLQDKSDSTLKTEAEKQAKIDFGQAARVVGGTVLAAAILVGTAAFKAFAGRRPPGP
jgi:hypothetical protein